MVGRLRDWIGRERGYADRRVTEAAYDAAVRAQHLRAESTREVNDDRRARGGEGAATRPRKRKLK
jgi:hypothetical protein